jgi:hypothetical protein
LPPVRLLLAAVAVSTLLSAQVLQPLVVLLRSSRAHRLLLGPPAVNCSSVAARVRPAAVLKCVAVLARLALVAL